MLQLVHDAATDGTIPKVIVNLKKIKKMAESAIQTVPRINKPRIAFSEASTNSLAGIPRNMPLRKGHPS